MRSRSTIAIVGASARAAAFSTLRCGQQALTADLFADADLRRQCPAVQIDDYPAGLLDWLTRTDCDGWLYTGALENVPELVDRMSEIRPLWGNPAEVLREVRSNVRLAKVLGQADLLFPESRLQSAGLPGDGSWLIKRNRSSSGSGVATLAASEDTLHVGGDGDVSTTYQRRVEGVAASAVMVADGRRSALLGVTRQLVGQAWTGAAAFQYCGSIGPLALGPDVVAQIARIGDVLAESFGLCGLFGIDLVIDGSDVWTIEVNPRYTASVEVVERATGRNAIEAHLAACLQGRLCQPWLAQQGCFGKAILFTKQPVQGADQLWDWALHQAGPIDQPHLADVPSAGTSLDMGSPVLTVFASGTTDGAVEAQLRRSMAKVQRRL